MGTGSFFPECKAAGLRMCGALLQIHVYVFMASCLGTGVIEVPLGKIIESYPRLCLHIINSIVLS